MGNSLRKIGDFRNHSDCKSSCCNKVEKSYEIIVCSHCGSTKKIAIINENSNQIILQDDDKKNS